MYVSNSERRVTERKTQDLHESNLKWFKSYLQYLLQYRTFFYQFILTKLPLCCGDSVILYAVKP